MTETKTETALRPLAARSDGRGTEAFMDLLGLFLRK